MLEDKVVRCVVFIKTDSRIMRDISWKGIGSYYALHSLQKQYVRFKWEMNT